MYKIFGITDTGKVREHNEDCFMINGTVSLNGQIYIETEEEENTLIAVADGMGGLAAGEVASASVLISLSEYAGKINKDNIDEVINEVNTRLFSKSEKSQVNRGMGSTLVGISLNGEENILFNVGDSRGYLYRDGFINQLTTDQTLTQQLFRAGVISREEIKTHPKSHLLTQCMGGDRKVQIDSEVIVNTKIMKSDIVMLCSDGLHNKLDEDDLEDILELGLQDLKAAGEKLVERANELGGEDNITLILVQRV